MVDITKCLLYNIFINSFNDLDAKEWVICVRITKRDMAVLQDRNTGSSSISIPLAATYRIMDGRAVLIDAEYMDIPADLIARFLLDGLHVPVDENLFRVV